MMILMRDFCLTCDISLDFTQVCSGGGNSDFILKCTKVTSGLGC